MDVRSVPEWLEAGPDTQPVVYASKLLVLPFELLTPMNFERLALRLVRRGAEVVHAQQYGDPGQDQHGIDLYCRMRTPTATGRWYMTVQCRNVASTTATDLAAAVEDFLEGAWARRTGTFVFATRVSNVRSERAEAVEAAAALLRDVGIAFEVWDGDTLSDRLYEAPSLVDQFFGRDAVRLHCGPEAADRLAQSAAETAHWPLSLMRRDTAVLIGRDAELKAGQQALRPRDGRPLVIVTGPPGVGKTALAVRLSHLAAADFPDGSVFLDASERSIGETEVPDAVVMLWEAVEPVPPGNALTRSQLISRLRRILIGRRLLVVVDDVATEAAVQELLAVSTTIGIICASRSRLSGLTASGAHHLELTPLTAEDAAALALSTAGSGRLTTDEGQALADVCGGLPLAIQIASSRLARRPTMSVADYLQRLRDPDKGIESLKAGQLMIGPIIDDSYHALSGQEAEIIRALGILPNAAVPAEVVAAAVAGEPEKINNELIERVRDQLDDLYELSLVDQPRTDRYRLHDVLYRFARNRAQSSPDAWRDAVIANACRMYAALIQAALASIGFVDDEARTPAPSNAAALQDLDGYRAGCVDCITSAARRELWDPLVLLCWAITPYLTLRSNWADLGQISEYAREAGERTGNTQWESAALLNLGKASATLGDPDAALELFRRSVDAAGDDDPLAAHLAYAAYGGLLLDSGQLLKACQVLKSGLPVWRQIGNAAMLVQTLRNIGTAYLGSGHWRRAEMYLRNAQQLASLHRFIGVEAGVQRSLAALYRMTGRIGQARTSCELVLQRARAIGDRGMEASALLETALTNEHDRIGYTDVESFDAALAIYREIGDAAGLITTLYLLGTRAAGVGDAAVAERHLSECLELAETSGDRSHVALAAAELAARAGEMGKDEQAAAGFDHADSAASEAGSAMLVARVHTKRAQWDQLRGRPGEAAALLHKVIAIIEPHGDSEPLTAARGMLAEALIQQNRWQEAHQLLQRVLGAPNDAVRPASRATALRQAAILYSRRGLAAEALAAAQQALSLAEAAGAPLAEMHCRATLGTTLARMGRWEQASLHLNAAADLAARHNQIVQLVGIGVNQATAEYRTGNRDAALERIRTLIGLTERLHLDSMRAALHNNLGTFLVDDGDIEAAINEFDAARALAVALGDSAVEATAQTHLAKAYLAHDSHAEAAEAADQAWRLHQDCGEWRAAAEALLFKIYIEGIDTTEDLQAALQRLHDNDEPLTNGVVANLNALLASTNKSESAETPPMPGQPSTNADQDEHVSLHTPATLPGRRINIAPAIRTELSSVDLAAVTSHLSEAPARCYACRLAIADDGEAELLLIINRESADRTLSWTSLAHPSCVKSTIISTDDRPNEQVHLELECTFVGDRSAAIFVNCRGGLGAVGSSKIADAMLTYLRELGFSDVGGGLGAEGQPQLSLPSAEPAPKLVARLVHDRLTVESDGLPVIADTPLDFYPTWYKAAQRGLLVLMFGRQLNGMSTDNPQTVLRAAQAGQLVAALMPIKVVTPRRNDPCPCRPRTGLKYKRCCGRVQGT